MTRTKPESLYHPGDWVLIDFAAPHRDYFQPNAFGRVRAQVPVGKAWYAIEYIHLVDGEFREDHAPASALRHYTPSEEEIDAWYRSRSTTAIPA